jgi:hypothetical protein
MASRKDLKKDIDALVFDLISDCYDCIDEDPDRDFSGYEQIINEIIDLEEELLSRINQYDSKKGTNSNTYFNNIKAELAEGLKKGYEDLKALNK